MNARIVNLRTARKQKARVSKGEKADRNAVEHGRSRAERKLTDRLNKIEQDRLDGHKRDDER